jgi:hypothetical protein
MLATGAGRGRKLRTTRTLLAAFALVCAAPGVAAASERVPFWSGPIPIDSGPPTIGVFTGLSCTAASFCVAADNAGNVLTTANPTGLGGEWSRVHLEDPEKPEGFVHGPVSCASPRLCVTIGGSVGGVFVSTDPLGGSATWKVEDIDPDGALRAIACVAPSLCVAAGEHGEVLTSTDPAAGAGAWTLSHVVGGGEIIGRVSCASSSLCVAVGSLGQVFTSTDPTSGEWQRTSLPWPEPPAPPPAVNGFSLSCVQGPLCVVGGRSAIFAATNPAGGAAAWTADDGVDASGDVSCDPAPRCVAFPGDWNGPLITTNDPTAGAGSWHPDGVGYRWMAAVSCISSSTCIALDPLGDEFVSTPSHLLSVSLLGTATGRVESTPISCPFLTCSQEVPGIIEPASAVAIACANDLPGAGHSEVGTCGLDYPWSDHSTLTARPAAGAAFAGWSGACTGTSPCTVSMSEDHAVSATFTTAAKPSADTVPRISHLRESHRAFIVAGGRTPLRGTTARRPPQGTLFSFAMDRAATVGVEISSITRGARIGRRCTAVQHAPQRARGCVRYTRAATLVRDGRAGLNRVPFSGRIGAKRLAPGAYRATFTATDAAGRSSAHYLSFTVLGS